jgi:hypothetical protein
MLSPSEPGAALFVGRPRPLFAGSSVAGGTFFFLLSGGLTPKGPAKSTPTSTHGLLSPSRAFGSGAIFCCSSGFVATWHSTHLLTTERTVARPAMIQ